MRRLPHAEAVSACFERRHRVSRARRGSGWAPPLLTPLHPEFQTVQKTTIASKTRSIPKKKKTRTHSLRLKKDVLYCLPIQDQIFIFFSEKSFFAQNFQPCLLSCKVVSEKNQKKNPFPYHYIFEYPLTNNVYRYLENKQLKNGGLNTLRVPKTGKVCHVFDPGAHTGRVEAKDGNIIETQHLNIESKHQLKAHCAII